MYSLSCRDLKKLQCVQNSLVRIVTRMPKYSRAHITPVLKSLHWLPIKQRIRFKTASIISNFCILVPQPILALILHAIHVQLIPRRSNFDNLYLHVLAIKPLSSPKYSFKTPSVMMAPRLWNALPHEIRSAPTLSSFRLKLKTYLFQEAYPP